MLSLRAPGGLCLVPKGAWQAHRAQPDTQLCLGQMVAANVAFTPRWSTGQRVQGGWLPAYRPAGEWWRGCDAEKTLHCREDRSKADPITT